MMMKLCGTEGATAATSNYAPVAMPTAPVFYPVPEALGGRVLQGQGEGQAKNLGLKDKHKA